MDNTGSNPIRRAAGVILWHLERGGSNATAIAKASAREPQLTEDQLRHALGWANAAMTFRDIWKVCDDSCTIADAVEQSGLAYYRDPSNFPPDA